MSGSKGSPSAPKTGLAPSTGGGVSGIAPAPVQGAYGMSALNSGAKDYGLSFNQSTTAPYSGQSLSKTFTQQNDKAMGMGKLDSAYANQKSKSGGDKRFIQVPALSPGNTGEFNVAQSNPQTGEAQRAGTIQAGAGAIGQAYDDGTLQKFLMWQKQNGF